MLPEEFIAPLASFHHSVVRRTSSSPRQNLWALSNPKTGQTLLILHVAIWFVLMSEVVQ
jgi:hypothetical protein